MDLTQITPTLDMNSASILANQNSFNNSSSITQSGNIVNKSGTKAEAQIRTSAQGFERILIRQMLSTMRNPNLRGDDGSNPTSTAYLEISDDNLATMMAKGKGMGLGNALAEQLLKQAQVKQLITSQKNAVNTSGSLSGSVASSPANDPLATSAN